MSEPTSQAPEWESITASAAPGDEHEAITAAAPTPPAEPPAEPTPVDLTALSDEELATHTDDVRARLTAGLDDAETPTDDLESLAADLDAALAEGDTRAAAAEADQARRAALRARLEPAAEPEGEGDPEAEADPEEAPEAVAAAAAPVTRQPAPARRPAPRVHRSPAPASAPGVRLTALPENGKFANDTDISVDQLATMASDILNRLPKNGNVKNIARLSAPVPAGTRKFGPNANNWAVAEELVAEGSESRTAAGGLCGLLSPIHDVMALSTPNYRPMARALPSRAADRGGFQLMPGPVLSATVGGSDIITEAEDTTGATAPCLAFVCDTARTFEVDKIPVCNTFGTMLGRTNPEMVKAWLQESVARRDSIAEGRILGDIRASSLVVTAGGGLGAWREYFARMAEIAANYRNNPRRRMGVRAPILAFAPQWMPDKWMADAARGAEDWEGIPSIAEIEGVLKDKLGITMNWYADTPLDEDAGLLGANMQFPVQNAGTIVPFPVATGTAVFAPGVWGIADGGEMDFGVSHDHAQNILNNYSIMTEIFERAVWFGPAGSSVWFEHTSCPDGTKGAGVDVACPIV